MITVRECMWHEVERFRKLEGEYHYMGESHGAGDIIRLIFEEDGVWLALMTWGASCYALKARDEFLEWNPVMRQKRLKLIVNNRRFTLLTPKGTRPNLASQILALAMRELPDIWLKKWGYKPLWAETFCDIEVTAGTCYRAAGWKQIGKTKGFSRVNHARDFYIPNGRPKVLYMKPFRNDAKELIISNNLPKEYLEATHTRADGILPIKENQVESLHWQMCHVKDPRGRNKSVGIGTLLTLLVIGVASGAKDLKEVVSFAKRLNNYQLKLLACPKAKDKFNKLIDYKRTCPSYTAFYHLLTHKDKRGRHDFSVADFAEKLSEWMISQAGKLPRHLAIDGKFIKELVGLVSLVDTETGDVIAVAPSSRKAGVKGECELPVVQKTLTKMDLSNAVVTADALHCQHKTAQIILEQGGDYILQVKGNQETLEKQCQTLCKIRPRIDRSKKKN